MQIGEEYFILKRVKARPQRGYPPGTTSLVILAHHCLRAVAGRARASFSAAIRFRISSVCQSTEGSRGMRVPGPVFFLLQDEEHH